MGYLLSLLFFIINLLTNSHYGFTWDLPHHFNAGLRHLGLPPQDPQFGTQPYGPISDTLPVLSWLYFYQKWHLLPEDEAYHLIPLLFASLGILLIYNLTKQIYGFLPALFATLILGLYPRYVGEAHNNPKDIPSAVAICLSLYLFLLFFQKISNSSKNTIKNKFIIDIWLLSAALAVGIAFNIKINAILIPPIIFFWLILSFRDRIKIKIPYLFKSFLGPLKFSLLTFYFLLSFIFSLLIWWPFWPNPFDQLLYIWKHFSQSTTGFWILYYGKIYLANINVPWHYAFGYLAAVTPTLLIFFFTIGFLKTLYDTKTLKNRYSGLLLSWFLVPTLKYAYPKVGVLDNIRHFLEVLFPLAILAGLGASLFLKWLTNFIQFLKLKIPTSQKILRGRAQNYEAKNNSSMKQWSNETNNQPVNRLFGYSVNRYIFILFFLFLVSYLLIQNLSLHPYQTAYYSEWLGGVKGANGKFDIEYWGNALKEGSVYLNQIAPPHSQIASPFAQQVARKYLRSDLQVVQYPTPKTQYLIFFNRSSFFDMYPENWILRSYLANQEPLFTIQRQNTPLLWVYKYP